MENLVNKQELAELQGISLPTVNRWIAEGMPIASKGGRGKSYEFDNAAVTRWRVERAEKKVGAKATGESEAASKARKLSAEAGIQEMKEAQLRDELVVKADLVEDIQNDFAKIRARLLAIPNRAAPIVVGVDEREARKYIADLIHEALEELSTIPFDEAFLPANNGIEIPEKKFVGNVVLTKHFLVDFLYDVEGSCEKVTFDESFTAPPQVD